MAAITSSDFGAQKIKSDTASTVFPLTLNTLSSLPHILITTLWKRELGTKRLGDLPQIFQQVSGRVRLWTSAGWLQFLDS